MKPVVNIVNILTMNQQFGDNNHQSNGNITFNSTHHDAAKTSSAAAQHTSASESKDNDDKVSNDDMESNLTPVVSKDLSFDVHKRVILPNAFIPTVKKDITLSHAAQWISYLPYMSLKHKDRYPVYQREELKEEMKSVMIGIWNQCYQMGEDAFEDFVIKQHSGLEYNGKPLSNIKEVAAMYEGNGPDAVEEESGDPFYLAKLAYDLILSQTGNSSPFMREKIFEEVVKIGSKCNPSWTIQLFPIDRKALNYNCHRLVTIAGKGAQNKKQKFNSIMYGSAGIGLALTKPKRTEGEESSSVTAKSISARSTKRSKTMLTNKWFVPTDWSINNRKVYVTIKTDTYAPLANLDRTPTMKQARSAVNELCLHQCAVRFINKARSEGKSIDQVLDLIKIYFNSKDGDRISPSKSPDEGKGNFVGDGLISSLDLSPIGNSNQWFMDEGHHRMPHQQQFGFETHRNWSAQYGQPVSSSMAYPIHHQPEQVSHPYRNQPPPLTQCQYPYQPPPPPPTNLPHNHHCPQLPPIAQPDKRHQPPLAQSDNPQEPPFFQHDIDRGVNPYDLFRSEGTGALPDDRDSARTRNFHNHDVKENDANNSLDDIVPSDHENAAIGNNGPSGKEDVLDNESFQVERILAKDPVKMKYYVEWYEEYDGEYGEARYTWEPVSNVDPDLAKDFESTYKGMVPLVRFCFYLCFSN